MFLLEIFLSVGIMSPLSVRLKIMSVEGLKYCCLHTSLLGRASLRKWSVILACSKKQKVQIKRILMCFVSDVVELDVKSSPRFPS